MLHQTQNKSFKNFIFGAFFILLCFSYSYGQYTINGPSSATAGQTKSYTLSGPIVLYNSWSVNNGATIISSSNNNITVKFNNGGNTTISASILAVGYVGYGASKTVSVSGGIPGTPANPTIASNNCGQATLQRTGSPGSGITWYWQGKTSNGTSTSKGSGSTYVPNEGNGTYYIRARNSSGQWSTGSGSRSVTIANFSAGGISGTQSICYAGDPSTLGNSPGPSGGSGYTLQWQYSNNGSSGWTNISGATLYTYNPPAGLTSSRWYRRRVISCSQTKYTNTIKVTVYGNLNAGSINGTATVCYGGNPSSLGNASSPSGGNGSYAYQWQISSNGTSGWSNISGGTSSTYNPPGGLTSSKWYRRRVISCGQTKYTGSIKITVASTPGTPSTPTITNNCGSTLLTRGTPPSGITWYWQSSSSGTSTSNSGTSVTRTSGTTYYLRGRNSSGCWGTSRTITYTITQPTTWYADTDGDGYGNSSSTTSDCSQPSGYVANSSDHDDGTVLVTNLTPQTYYSDVDGDGYGDGATTLYASFKRLGYADNNTDQCPNDPGSGNGCEAISITPSDENYVSTRTYQDASETEAIESVAYFDGLGRTKQNVFVRGSGKASAQTPNIAPGWTMDWSEGTGGTAFFNRNGEVSENARIWAPDPFGNNNLVWECGNKPDSGSDGGWNTDYFNVDKTKTYRYTVWVRRNHSQNGSTYHGTQNVDNLGGGANGNPYFWSGDLPQLDEWYLLVGIVHPYTHGSTDTGVSGVYDLQGNRVIDGTEYKWRSDTTDSRFRSYLYYCTDVNVRQYFYDPKVEVVDGSELPLQKLFDDGKPKDVVTHVEYDDYGRASKQYLPYMEYNGLGTYRSSSKTATNDHYINTYPSDINSGTPNPYSETQFEASPLNRVLKQAAPGYDWRMGGGHEIEFGYDTNDANEVRHFSISFSGGNTEAPQLINHGTYPANALYKKVTYDENHTSGTDHSTEEFTDKLGQVLLKRTYNNGAHDTYYVYDDFGNLTYVLPPKVTVDNVSSTELSELCYQYKYDHRNRLVEKKLPGKGWEYIVYDKLNRPIMTQDANLKALNQWLFTKYDAFGRVIYTGRDDNTSSTRAALQNAADNTADTFEEKRSTALNLAGTNVYYSNDAYPTSYNEVLTINYYDNYEDEDGLAVPTTVLGQAATTNTHGLPTVSKVRVLGTTDWITTINGYDAKGRPIYTASKNNYLNTVDAVLTQLDFVGKPLQVKTDHTKAGLSTITTIDDFTYDQAARLVKQEQTIGGHTEELVRNEYGELGQLKKKTVGGSLQTVDYTYNVRGWLKQINDPANLGNDLFAFDINYNTADHGGTALHNGNIAETEWKTANDNALRWYRYGYDPLNRITSAIDNSANYNLYDITYDENGNILTLKRKGNTNAGATTFGTMDNLVYTYKSVGNQLKRVKDYTTVDQGYNDGIDTTEEYTYDANGNMLRDLNKGISSNIGYNHLNLPTSIGLGGGTISYIYDATGAKLKKTVSTGGNMEYAGNYVYESGALQFFNHPEGYVTPDGSGGYDYVYQYKDHLGNVRLSYQDGNDNGSVDAAEIVEESNYYPFGLKHKGYNANVSSLGNGTAQKWKYNGMEHDESLGLETYDFGARNYDPALGRWMNIDPLAEQMRRHSPYNYAYSNPVAFIDPDGMLGQATYASGAGVSLSVLGSMFTESEAAQARQARQNIYTAVNNALADDGDKVEQDCCGGVGNQIEQGFKNQFGKLNRSINKLAKDIKSLFKGEDGITRDGLAVYGEKGADPQAGNGIVKGEDRGNGGSISITGEDINPFNTMLTKSFFLPEGLTNVISIDVNLSDEALLIEFMSNNTHGIELYGGDDNLVRISSSQQPSKDSARIMQTTQKKQFRYPSTIGTDSLRVFRRN